MLYSKGAVLLPPQPYQYGGPKDNAFQDKNLLRFGHPTNDLPHDWADSNVMDAQFGASVDYAWSSSGYPDWFINPDSKPGFSQPRALQAGLNQQEGGFTWDRQVAFLKGTTAKSPTYFVIMDSTSGSGKLASWFNLSLLGRKKDLTIDGQKLSLDTEWPNKLDLLFPGRQNPAFETVEDDLPLAVGPYSRYAGPVTEGHSPSRNWVDQKGQTVVMDKRGLGVISGAKEQHLALRLQSAPGEEVSWVLYPRGAAEAAPTTSQLAPGVTRVVTGEGTDYVFLSPTPLTFSAEGVTFSGLSGAVRLARGGQVTLVLTAGPGHVGYRDRIISSEVPFERVLAAKGETATIALSAPTYGIAVPAALEGGAARAVVPGVTRSTAGDQTRYVVIAPAALDATDGNVRLHARRATVQLSPGQVRFVVPERAYVQLSAGNVGVRGVGPFDLSFTAQGVTGQVDGAERTLVTMWPEKVTRPMFHMDNVLWYAGFADEHSFVRGVSAGLHQVKLGEWQWPALPPAVPRATLAVAP